MALDGAKAVSRQEAGDRVRYPGATVAVRLGWVREGQGALTVQITAARGEIPLGRRCTSLGAIACSMTHRSICR